MRNLLLCVGENPTNAAEFAPLATIDMPLNHVNVMASLSRQQRRAATRFVGTVEDLEYRRLMSVTVTTGFPGYYDVTGTEQNDSFNVNVNASGVMYITENGHLQGPYSGVSYVTVNLLGGDDTNTTFVSGAVGASIHAGDGNDNVSLTGSGAIWGDGGNDTIKGTDSDHLELYGGPGDDIETIVGTCANSNIHGGDGADRLDATNSVLAQYLYGDAGNDTLLGSGADDQLYPGTGSDFVVGNAGNDEIYGGDGETDQYLYGGTGIDTIFCDFNDPASAEYIYRS
jgi:Ca2+-binding RTX toxin-like protein